MKHYYLRYETFENESIAYDLTGDEERSLSAVNLDIPFYRIEQIIGSGQVSHCGEEVYYGARDWLASITATEEQVEAIKRTCGPFVQWLTESEYDELYALKHPRS